MLTASLPMYNLPEMRERNRRFWSAIRQILVEAGLAAPETLTFERAPVPTDIGAEVLLTQTCGYPLQTTDKGQYALLGRPSYDAVGCVGDTHCAVMVVPQDSAATTLEALRGSRFALNSRHSNSGFNLPRRLLAPLAHKGRFFGEVVETGGHGASISLVAEGRVDCASIDSLTYQSYLDFRPETAARLRVVAQTPPSPTLPFVTSAATPAEHQGLLRQALFRVTAEPAYAEARAGLRIIGMSEAHPSDYAAIMAYETEAAAMGYPDIA